MTSKWANSSENYKQVLLKYCRILKKVIKNRLFLQNKRISSNISYLPTKVSSKLLQPIRTFSKKKTRDRLTDRYEIILKSVFLL